MARGPRLRQPILLLRLHVRHLRERRLVTLPVAPARPGLEGWGIQQDNPSGLETYYYDANDSYQIGGTPATTSTARRSG